MKKPLIVYLVWHPLDAEAGAYAKAVLRRVYADPDMPGAERLGIPVRFRTSNDPAELPKAIDLDESDASVVVILYGDAMSADRENCWRDWLAGIVARVPAARAKHRCIFASLTVNALGDANSFPNMNLTRLHLVPAERREHELVIAVLRTCALALDVQPVKVFLSHTKADGAGITAELREAVQAARLDKFFDAQDIDDGMNSLDEIIEQVASSAAIVVLTDKYATREWCRLEAIRSIQAGRPLVVLDALEQGEVRSMPYLSNVPVVRLGPDRGDSFDRCIVHCLREVVRCRFFPAHAKAAIAATNARLAADQMSAPVGPVRAGAKKTKQGSAFDPVVFASQPDLFSLLMKGSARSGLHIVYPDPPLGAPELGVLMSLQDKLVARSITEWRAQS